MSGWSQFGIKVGFGGLLFLSLDLQLSLHTRKSVVPSYDLRFTTVEALAFLGHQLGVAVSSGSALVGC